MSNNTLILASSSQARQTMLKNAGVQFDIIPANIDEKSIINEMINKNQPIKNITLELAKNKSLELAKNNKDKYIIGSDQILSLDNKIFSKSKTQQEVKNKLLELQNKTHHLTSSVCVSQNDKILWHKTDTARLTMKELNEQDIDNYIKNAGDNIYQCVGGYALESIGIQLFDDIKGDYFTILGMPLLPLINFLNKEGLS